MTRRHHRSVQWLLKRFQQQPKLVGAEIGVFRGDLSRSLLDAFPNLHIHLVDMWKAAASDSAYAKSGDKAAQQTEDEHLANKLLTLRAVEPFVSRVTIWHCMAEDAAKAMVEQGKRGSLDFIFIDGDHTKEGVVGDIRRWWALVKKGGLVAGHDYGHRRHVGVKEAVDEFVARNKLQLGISDKSSVWFVTKPT